MTRLGKLEREIEALPPQDIRALGDWMDGLRQKLREQELVSGSPSLDDLAAQALKEHKAGDTTPLVHP